MAFIRFALLKIVEKYIQEIDLKKINEELEEIAISTFSLKF